MASLKIRRFDPSTIKPDRVWLLIGKRGTGKSTLIRDLMYHMRKYINVPIAMTPTEESVSMFESCMPESCVHTDFNTNTVDSMITHQRQRGRKKKKPQHILMVFDDMMFDKRVLKGQAIRNIFMNGRHLKITFMNAVQYCMDMSPDLRSQVDYCFALRENIVSNRTKLWKYFFGGFAHFDDFCKVFNECTANNECLVIDNTVKSNDVADMIFWYKADIDIGDYLLGDRTIWDAHHKYYRSEQEIEDMKRANLAPVSNAKQDRITHVAKAQVDGTVGAIEAVILST